MATRRKTTPKKEVRQTWKVMSVPVPNGECWMAYRLKDEAKPDEASNRISRGGLWQTKKEAEDLAKRLNEEVL